MDRTNGGRTPATLDDQQRRSLLRRALASALRAAGHERIAMGDYPTTQPMPTAWAVSSSVLAFIWMVGATIGDRADLPWWSWPLLGLGVLFVFGVLFRRQEVGGVVLLLTLVGSLWWELAQHGLVIVTHAVPAALVVAVAVLTKRVDVRSVRDLAVAAAAITRSAPLLAPLVLVVLLLPALSQDVWVLAANLHASRLVPLALLTVVLLFILVAVSLRSQLSAVVASRCSALASDASRADKTRKQMAQLLAPHVFGFVDGTSGSAVVEAWPADGAEYAPMIAATEGSTLRRPLAWRLGLCTAFVAVFLCGYLYVLLALLVSTDVADTWTQTHVSVAHLHLGFATLNLPGGVYVQVSLLLGCLATATFLAFALIEERFATALGDALLKIPVDRLLVLALPYLTLVEERIEVGDDLDPNFDVGQIEG